MATAAVRFTPAVRIRRTLIGTDADDARVVPGQGDRGHSEDRQQAGEDHVYERAVVRVV
jgi:hypothetical protein